MVAQRLRWEYSRKKLLFKCEEGDVTKHRKRLRIWKPRRWNGRTCRWCRSQETVECANRRLGTHYVCLQHAYRGTDVAGGYFCSEQCWNERPTDFAV